MGITLDSYKERRILNLQNARGCSLWMDWVREEGVLDLQLLVVPDYPLPLGGCGWEKGPFPVRVIGDESVEDVGRYFKYVIFQKRMFRLTNILY